MSYLQKKLKDYIDEVAVEIAREEGKEPSKIWKSKKFQDQITSAIKKQIIALEAESNQS
ncbi:MAG TPA: hypothetical protein VLA13_10565 [Massilibacterium sp.]|nr:hypothetical protein [Massilibacterium sp.]